MDGAGSEHPAISGSSVGNVIACWFIADVAVVFGSDGLYELSVRCY